MKRLCIFCKYFYFENASPGYSEWTPGSDVDVICWKNKFEFSIYDSDFNDTLKTAQECTEYSLSDDAREMGAPE